MGTCLRIPEVNVDSTIGTVRGVLDESRVTSKNKMLVERATSQRPLDAVQRYSLSTSIQASVAKSWPIRPRSQAEMLVLT